MSILYNAIIQPIDTYRAPDIPGKNYCHLYLHNSYLERGLKAESCHLTSRYRPNPRNSQIGRDGNDPDYPERARVVRAIVPEYDGEDDASEVTHSAYSAGDDAFYFRS